MDEAFFRFVITIVVVAIVLSWFLKLANQHERLAVFTLGRFDGIRGPGLVFITPIFQTVKKINIGTTKLDLQFTNVHTEDLVRVKGRFTVKYKVVEPEITVTQVKNIEASVIEIAESSIRSFVGMYDANDILISKIETNKALQDHIDQRTKPLGIGIVEAEIHDSEPMQEGFEKLVDIS